MSWLQPTYSFLAPGGGQCHYGENIIGTSNGTHTAIVIELYIAMAIHFTKGNIHLYSVMQCIFSHKSEIPSLC